MWEVKELTFKATYEEYLNIAVVYIQEQGERTIKVFDLRN